MGWLAFLAKCSLQLHLISGLIVKEMEELHNDIKMHLDLDTETPMHIEYWKVPYTFCAWMNAFE